VLEGLMTTWQIIVLILIVILILLLAGVIG
jgi:hypothetical protein